MRDLSRAPVLVTKRLTLRLPTEADFEGYAALYGDPVVMAGVESPPINRGEAWLRMAGLIGHWALRGYGPFAVCETEGGAFVGRVGLWRPEAWPELELIWTLSRPAWGKGYATEAARAARDWAFPTYDLERLVSFIRPWNARSLAVAQRLGAQQDGEIEVDGKPLQVWKHRQGA
jgi:RimJ/RimL family protein N-acetyltransferase